MRAAMNERERWIVYPLLFLALGAGLRDKLIDRTTSRSIVCQELVVQEDVPAGRETPRVLVKIGRTDPDAGEKQQGFLFVDGLVSVDGEMRVTGTVNSRNYAYRDIPVLPTFQAAVPSATLEHILRGMQKSLKQDGPPNGAQPQPKDGQTRGDGSQDKTMKQPPDEQ
jgi:hypothetical protein